MKREERAAKKRREDEALNRVLWWFGGAVVLEFFLLLLNRFYVHYDAGGVALARTLALLLRGLVWVGLAALVVSAAWLGVWKAKGKRLFAPTVSLLIWAAVVLCAYVSGRWAELGVQALYLTVPAVAVLALIYYLFQREFFIVALEGAVALLSMWAYRRLILSRPQAVYLLFAAAAVLILALAALTLGMWRQDGRILGRQVLARGANYLLLAVGAAVALAALAAAVLLGATAAYVALFGVVAWLFGAAVYYTAKLL